MGNKIKRNRFVDMLTSNGYSWLAALLAVIVMLFVMLCHKIYPFGDMTILRMDLYHQYGPLYAELYDKLTTGGSLFYSWESGLGGAFLGNLLNYCSSPFAIVMLIAGHYHMPGAIAAMITLKAALAAWTFTYFIKKSFGKSGLSGAAFALAYTFCGWFVAYYWDLMWVDAFAVFPLVILGIEYIIQGKKPWMFILSLTYVLFTNYYMGYMTVIMSVIYFLFYYFGRYTIGEKRDPMLRGKTVYYVNDEGEELQKTLKPTFLENVRNSRFIVAGAYFACSGLVAALLACAALLPVYFSLKTSSATGNSWPSTYKLYFNFFDFLANHLASLDTTIRSSGDIVLPNVYCTMATVVIAPMYFFCKKISY
ncbi:MAG: YfhO family protein, partial [Clostridia bacterium]|nr:YfhO family protein [Clostridia bacterium]